MSNSLLEAFNVKHQKRRTEDVDFLIFKDKNLLDKFRIKIIEELSKKDFSQDGFTKEAIDFQIDEITYGYDLDIQERSYLYDLIDGEVNGYGPINELLKDDSVNEIMINSPSEIYIETEGKIIRDKSVSFINDEHIVRIIEKLVEPTGKMIDINNPMVDASLDSGVRINAIIPPLSKNPILTIRKFQKDKNDMDSLIGAGTLTPYMARFLEAAVKAKLNIIVSGSAGSGKTSLLNTLGNFISNDERVITIEDIFELDLKSEHVVSLETKIPNYDGLGGISVRELVRNSLRMRPDRIIIGEVRGSEAFDLLQAMNTGHEGSLTTLHANGPKDALDRLETMVLMDGLELTIPAIRGYISNAVDLVVQISRMRDGKRKITHISEVIGVKDGELEIRNIFEFKVKGSIENDSLSGEYILYPNAPKVLKKIQNAGISDIDDMFKIKKK